jgi:hypothetical protein
MVFWRTYPLTNLLKSKFNNNRFTDLVFERKIINSPTGIEGRFITKENFDEICEVKLFLKKYFGNPPTTPILDIPEDKLIGNLDHILVVRDSDNDIVGCIRYHYLGLFVSDKCQKIYCEDCFCIHPNWRKKGVGDYMLTKLHIFVNATNKPYSMFLKEGKKLSIINQPYYSSFYVYKRLIDKESQNVSLLTKIQAYKLMDIFSELNKDIFIVRNIESDNQEWILYRLGAYKVLACVQDTYQRFEEEGQIKKIGWITGWIESSNMTDIYREKASKEISDFMFGKYDYLWSNIEWIGDSTEWKVDGPFNWYLYQWSTTLDIKKSYVIVN